jgi:hypothetical protein
MNFQKCIQIGWRACGFSAACVGVNDGLKAADAILPPNNGEKLKKEQIENIPIKVAYAMSYSTFYYYLPLMVFVKN